MKYDIVAYYFPGWHTRKYIIGKDCYVHPEWETLKIAKPRFIGHKQPKIPLWGYEDESDPKVMEKKIKLARGHGINAFIFDWYWNENGPFLDKCLNNGLLKADNIDKIKFALMWANHLGDRDGAILPSEFDKLSTYVIDNYFTHSSYWKVDEKPYFSIYQIKKFVESFGSISEAAKAIEEFRVKARKSNVGEIHINAVQEWGFPIPECAKAETTDPAIYLEKLGINSITSYCWTQHTKFKSFPYDNYLSYSKRAIVDECAIRENYRSLPYIPNVTVGWDPSPRTDQKLPFEEKNYPYTSVLIDNTPENFRKVLLTIKEKNR